MKLKHVQSKICPNIIIQPDLGHVIKLHQTSSTHQKKTSVRLQIPQLSVTAQREEKKGTE